MMHASAAAVSPLLLLLLIAAQDTVQEAAPKATTTVLLNPGKGWLFYGERKDFDDSTLAFGSTAYIRVGWDLLEPEEGRYRWDLLDGYIAEWAKAGKQSAFAVMCANSHGPEYTTPKWVFDAGAKFRKVRVETNNPTYGRDGEKIVPEFEDAIFLDKLKNFVAAMGKRYDGDKRIAFVDMRSYGNWGEGHLHPFGGTPISKDGLCRHVTNYLDAFKRTPVMMPWGSKDFEDVYDWAVSKGLGMRRDGVCGNSDGSETTRCLGKAPAVFEFYGPYELLKRNGWWDGKTHYGHGYKLVDCVERGAPSYISLSQWGGKAAKSFLEAEQELIERLANRMGYHIVITKAEVPRRFRASAPVTAAVTWENRGVAHLHLPCRVALALLDRDSKVAARAWADGASPAKWAPGKPVRERLTASFKDVTSAGPLRLAIGLCGMEDPPTPAIGLGIEGATTERWYPLSGITWE
ncbi:MAG: DUF4832 domain-containing protein [Planctomycetota bacterium]